MSNENNTKNVAGIVNTLKSNPKALLALGGAVVVVVLALMMGGEGEKVEVKTSVAIGQMVTLQNPNVGDTLLVAVPGKLGSADNEEEDGQNICVVKAGATATVEEETTVNYIPFVKVTVKDGDCQGKSGWTPKVNIKAK